MVQALKATTEPPTSNKKRKDSDGPAPPKPAKQPKQDPTNSRGEPPTKPRAIDPPRKVYRPGLPNVYREPELKDDPNDGLDYFYKDYGKSLSAQKEPLPPRTDKIKFDVATHSQELERNLNLKAAPSH